MLDPNSALQSLYNTLVNRGMSPEEAVEICREASIRLNSEIATIVANGINQAYEIGIENEMPDFVNTLDADINTFGVDITAHGNEILHYPREPMLPKLLKNGKLSKSTGKVYKVIPKFAERPGKHISISSMDSMKNRSDIIAQRREALAENNKNKIPDAMEITKDIIGSMTDTKMTIEKKPQAGTPVDFFTAHSGQDANTKWVRPARTIDIRRQIEDINENIYRQISEVVNTILASYGGR